MKYLTLFLMCVLLNPVYGGNKRIGDKELMALGLSTPERVGSVSRASTPKGKRKLNFDGLTEATSDNNIPDQQGIGTANPSTTRPPIKVTFYPDDVNEADLFGPEPTNQVAPSEPPHCRQEDIYRVAKKARRQIKKDLSRS